MKFAPVTVSVAAGAPATTVLGLKEATVGPFTVKVLAEETAVAVFCTVTFTEPAVASDVPGTTATREVEPPYPVGTAVVPAFLWM